MEGAVSNENAQHYRWGDGCDGWHLVDQGTLSVIQERVPPGKSEKPHYHESSRQFFFVLDGTATLEIDGKNVIVKEREGIEVPPKVRHLLRNNSNADLVFLVISSPRSHSDRVNI